MLLELINCKLMPPRKSFLQSQRWQRTPSKRQTNLASYPRITLSMPSPSLTFSVLTPLMSPGLSLLRFDSVYELFHFTNPHIESKPSPCCAEVAKRWKTSQTAQITQAAEITPGLLLISHISQAGLLPKITVNQRFKKAKISPSGGARL